MSETLRPLSQYELIQERISYFSSEMARLYVLGHEVHQSAEYEAMRAGYLQALADRAWFLYAEDPPKVYYKNSG